MEKQKKPCNGESDTFKRKYAVLLKCVMHMKTIESPQVSRKRRHIQLLKIRIYMSSRVAIVINDMVKDSSGRCICSKSILTTGCSNKNS